MGILLDRMTRNGMATTGTGHARRLNCVEQSKAQELLEEVTIVQMRLYQYCSTWTQRMAAQVKELEYMSEVDL